MPIHDATSLSPPGGLKANFIHRFGRRARLVTNRQQLDEVGNSGNTTEPLLYIRAIPAGSNRAMRVRACR